MQSPTYRKYETPLTGLYRERIEQVAGDGLVCVRIIGGSPGFFRIEYKASCCGHPVTKDVPVCDVFEVA
jgi:hypothetical protein